MSVPNEIKRLTEEVITSFDAGIGAVGLLIEKGLEILDGYRREQEAVNGSLRDSLASIVSLRHKDFDEVMSRILSFQSKREIEIKTLIKGFLAEQREITGKIKRSLEAGIFQEVEKGKRELKKMIDQAKEGILSFQQEQERIRATFAQLESQKDKLSVMEFKKVIQDLEEELLGEKPAASIQQSA
ncbi:MAG: hypothetical protein A3G32_03805 [Deltaproteobacteria bacterium RIFCSPLOWO2_12_FULL_40_28]|nr:MAG: hypothetical protein A3C45_05695 [Deltaproteobacteria bacterium RIFCSPHIGHO2_02_FULL_40_28]OGQ19446.1 MAG: hypothetical protein A3E27_06325 [Deltaproteobacteria bacterium RIFCSPHIGHO2_12_FULL_40_32]OGQ39890.1 MAG: hypothetical protein A3I69_07290 [Deltaproteobacteria bacterium RIFCSPLOWO2_02_FULL_40_36]OGQ53883.1 MAG: hypothetical protein A3G32_03805 [Deltaproteobacteria bacterium RIFCSPLOWO2_12_FULL_40_28]